MALAKGLDIRLVQLTNEGKDRPRSDCRVLPKQESAQEGIALVRGRLSLDPKSVPEEVRCRLKQLKQARAMIVENPDIRGGKPCIRVPRIGVYEVASMLEEGASEEGIFGRLSVAQARAA